MGSYEIIMTPEATEYLIDLCDYIAYVLLVPDTALAYIRTIRDEIGKLSEMPQRIKLVDDEPWHSRGVRKFLVKNFYAYYHIDEESKRVYIMNIIYSRREQLRQLDRMNFD